MIEWFARKSIGRLRRMLQSIRSQDFGVRFPEEKLHGEERKLAGEINDVITDFRLQLLQQERRYGQYEALLDTIGAALIVAGKDGDVRYMNRNAVEHLCGFRINRLSALGAVHHDLPQALQSLSPGQSRLLSLSDNGRERQVKISMVRYSVEGDEAFLYTIEDVEGLLLQNEMEAQGKLVSVLTHEIMNSLSPIISLSDSLGNSVSQSDAETQLALSAIKRRSQGLLSFVENYRKLSRLAPPKLHYAKIGDVFSEVRNLYSASWVRYDVSDSDMELRMDRHQIVQVLINLIKNGMEACSDVATPSVVVTAGADHPRRLFVITVADNGCGISPEERDKIYVPFYTTKPGGSGIGLSLSRRIVGTHGGSLQLDPTDTGSKFIILLPLIYRI